MPKYRIEIEFEVDSVDLDEIRELAIHAHVQVEDPDNISTWNVNTRVLKVIE